MAIQVLSQPEFIGVATLDEDDYEEVACAAGSSLAGEDMDFDKDVVPMPNRSSHSTRKRTPRRAPSALKAIAKAMQRFEESLPKLRQEHLREWVGVSSRQLEATGQTKRAVIAACHKKGLTSGQFIAVFVE